MHQASPVAIKEAALSICVHLPLSSETHALPFPQAHDAAVIRRDGIQHSTFHHGMSSSFPPLHHQNLGLLDDWR